MLREVRKVLVDDTSASEHPVLYRFTFTIVEQRVSHFFHQNASVVTPLSPVIF